MKSWIACGVTALTLIVIASCQGTSGARLAPFAVAGDFEKSQHAQRVMTSEFCASCHPAIYAEHAQNTHGRAFTDEEVRLATGRFDFGDCIRCHTPRPIFETGIGLNPVRRYHNLEEGNTCMTCHWKKGQDYGSFQGGLECTTAFDDRVGTVDACATCHRNHGTPYQWELAPTGKQADRTCMTCHMEMVRRPVAVGEKPRLVRSHKFPGARDEKQIRRAYRYEAKVEGDHVVVTISNVGAGHNFPTELKQRALESLVIVRDSNGAESYRSRMVFRDPYKRPYGLKLPVNTQIPAGQSRVHRVPLKLAEGKVDCELHFKHYFPIQDHHPTLARRLEKEELEFSDVTPSPDEVQTEPAAKSTTAEGITPEQASVANLVDFQKWVKIDAVDIPIPDGDSQEDIDKLVSLFQFPVPEGNRLAQARLVEIGLPAVPALIEALGSWDNKTFKQAMAVLRKIGEPAVPAVLEALGSDQLYVRYHARKIITDTDPGGFLDVDTQDVAMRARIVESLRVAVDMENAMDRRSALEAATTLELHELRDAAVARLADSDPDVIVAAAKCVATNTEDSASAAEIAAIEREMAQAYFPETRRELAVVLARLGNASGVPVLLDGLNEEDDLIREDFFESFFEVTGKHEGYEPFADQPIRLAAISRLRAWWAEEGGPDAMRWIDTVPPELDHKAWKLLTRFDDKNFNGEDVCGELTEMGSAAVPALVRGLKHAPGFDVRRQWICEALRRIGSTDGAPALAQALNDPVIRVADWACFALQSCGDEAVVPAVIRYRDRLLTLNAQRRIPAGLDFDQLIARCNRTLELFE